MVEFRLYYDDNGRVLCYTCEDLPGNYVVIDKDAYAAARLDVTVIDGKITSFSDLVFLLKLIPGAGTKTSDHDITILSVTGNTEWKLKRYEFRNN
jgi:uncharacterized protein RhaS with RHS repeats